MTESTVFAFEDERSARETAALLRELAAGVERGRIEFGEGATVDVADELAVELELEREGTDPEELELEVELEWVAPDRERVATDEPTAEAAGDEEPVDEESVAQETTPGEPTPGEPTGGEPGDEDVTEGADSGVADEGADEAGDPETLPEPPAAPEEVRARGESLATFQLFRDRREEWRWRLVHRNGNVIASSGEGYTARHNAEKGLRSVQANAPGADVEVSDE